MPLDVRGGPPKDVAPSALFVKLSGPRPSVVVDIPRKGPDGAPVGQVAIVVLTQEELIAAAAEAERQARKLLRDDLPKREEAHQGYDDVFQNCAAVQILFRACRDADDPKRPAFNTPHEIAAGLTNDEIGVLQHHYLTVQSELGPIVATMTGDELEAWIVALGEGGTAIPLGSLSWGMLTTLVLTMASRLRSLQTASSSAGSPQGEPAPLEGAPTPEEAPAEEAPAPEPPAGA